MGADQTHGVTNADLRGVNAQRQLRELAQRYLDESLQTRALFQWSRSVRNWPAVPPHNILIPGQWFYGQPTDAATIQDTINTGVSSAFVGGLQLQAPWSAHPAELAPLVLARWAALLQEAVDLHDQKAILHQDGIDWRRRHAEAVKAAEAERDRTYAAEVREAKLLEQLAAARADADRARQEARDAMRDKDAALAQADAWRASATATSEALAILRAALRPPEPALPPVIEGQ